MSDRSTKVKVNVLDELLNVSVAGSTATTTTAVADSATSVSILASNTLRVGASIFNDSSAALYLLLGSGTASSSNYTVRVVQYALYELPYGYKGEVNGIWATDPGVGAARITEFT